jgi:hypothetical protein
MSIDIEKDLELCPFCGTAPEVMKIGNVHTKMAVTIRCPECRIERTDATPKVRNYPNHDWLVGTATKNWNRRATQPAPIPAQTGAEIDEREGGLLAVIKTAETRMDAGSKGGLLVGGAVLTDEAKDAARYRFIRNNSRGELYDSLYCNKTEYWDDLIDAAIASHIKAGQAGKEQP